MLQQALTAGITACGTTVLQQGVIPTPVLAYLTKQTESNAGVMITASHNPQQYNGMKLFNSDTTAYSPHQEAQLEALIAEQRYHLTSWQNVSNIRIVNETQQYISMITQNVQLNNPWNLVIDPGNGATSQLAAKIFLKLDCKVTAINAQPDGYFPGRAAEPTEKSLQPLCRIVRKLKADLGIAYDGDGDRMVLVNETGHVTAPDQTLAAYAAHTIRQRKNKTIVTHVAASMCIDQMVEAEGGQVIRTKVGDVNITAAIRKHQATFGGEPCGAWIHPRFHYCPDGLLSSILLLRALEETGEKISEFISNVPQFPLLRRNISCPQHLKIKLMKKLPYTLPPLFPSVERQSKVDGFRVALKQGWLLVRPSGTEPLIRITVEAETKKTATALMHTATKLVSQLIKEAH
jgi:phosphoglucosamine mutase